MNKRHQTFKCDACGKIVQILHAGVGTIYCCNKKMNKLDDKFDISEDYIEVNCNEI